MGQVTVFLSRTNSLRQRDQVSAPGRLIGIASPVPCTNARHHTAEFFVIRNEERKGWENMKKYLILAAVIGIGSCLSVCEAKEASGMGKEPQAYKVTKLSEPVEIDGNWNKPAWKKIDPLVINRHMGENPAHRPGVLAKLAYDDNALYIIFRVDDRYVRAVAEKYQDPVYKDSCVEFFFTPGSTADLGRSYFNIEINCGGTMLFWWHPEGKEAIPVAPQDCDSVHIGHTLPKIVDPEIEAPTTWTLEYRLPFSAVRKYCPGASRPEPNAVWKANFYKCADATSHPHWLTWSFVDHPTPQFHLPEYFGTLTFE
jgi:hypothetical protein